MTLDDIDDLLYLTRVNEVSELQQTISDLAAKNNCTPGEILLRGVDPDSKNTVIHYASANGFPDLLKSFFAQLSDNNNQGRLVAVINSQNHQGNTALHWAAYNGHLEVAKCLLTGGANMWLKNASGHLAVFEAERAERNEVAQYLLEAAGERAERGATEGQPSAEEIAEIDVETMDVDVNGNTMSEGAEGASRNGNGALP